MVTGYCKECSSVYPSQCIYIEKNRLFQNYFLPIFYHFFFCDLFKYAVNISDYIALKCWTINEDVEGSGRGLFWDITPAVARKNWRKPRKPLLGHQVPVPIFELGTPSPPEYKGGAFTVTFGDLSFHSTQSNLFSWNNVVKERRK
jgi:hypothetical protein